VRSMFVKKNLVKSRARFSGVKFIVLGFDVTRLHSSGIKNYKSGLRKNNCSRIHHEYALIFNLKVGKWESGKVGKWESGKVGKWESGKVERSFSATDC